MRRGSIARLMTAIGLSALGLMLLREWLGPNNLFGFLGLLALLVMAALIAWLMTSGVPRRFFAGTGTTAVVLWVAVFIGSYSILDACRDRLILPVDRWVHQVRPPARTRTEDTFRKAEWGMLRDGHFEFYAFYPPPPPRWYTVRADLYRWHPELQALLLIPMAVLSGIGGLIAAIYRPRRTETPSPADPS